jgi:hypothetical protein
MMLDALPSLQFVGKLQLETEVWQQSVRLMIQDVLVLSGDFSDHFLLDEK